MGPRFSSPYEAGARDHQSPITSNTGEVQPSAVHVESKPGCDGGRYAWTSTSRRHVALLETIRERASRPRRVPSKPTTTVGGQLHHHGPAAATSSAADKRVWAKLIARLSRKMSGTRLTSSRSAAQQLPDGGVELPQAPGGLIRSSRTSTVLPVSRNAVTTTVAYNNDTKHLFNDNNNKLPSDDFASRVSQYDAIIGYISRAPSSVAKSSGLLLCQSLL